MHQHIKTLLTFLIVCPILASTVVAISDNQIDITHKDLKDHLFYNLNEYRNGHDSDGNGKVDDINGWNYISNSADVFDDSLIGTFDPRVFEYYEVRKKKTLKTATQEELNWYSEIRKDDKFMESRDDFSSYTHGSHVTCLAMNAMDTKSLPFEISANKIKFMPIRYLGDDPVGLFKKNEFKVSNYKTQSLKLNHIRRYMISYADWMILKFETTVKYATKHSRIYHASWGQSWEPSAEMVNELIQDEFNLSEKEVDKKFKSEVDNIRQDYMSRLLKRGRQVVQSYPNTLFIFSAGNKKDNTDTMLHYPSSIIASNVISVGASDEHNSNKAYFSNYGKKTVSIFAPGIAIRSCSPGDNYIPINGTSQAAPQVTNAAALIFEMADYYAKFISASEVKTILLDSGKKQATLKELCASGATLDTNSALRLARLRLFK